MKNRKSSQHLNQDQLPSHHHPPTFCVTEEPLLWDAGEKVGSSALLSIKSEAGSNKPQGLFILHSPVLGNHCLEQARQRNGTPFPHPAHRKSKGSSAATTYWEHWGLMVSTTVRSSGGSSTPDCKPRKRRHQGGVTLGEVAVSSSGSGSEIL